MQPQSPSLPNLFVFVSSSLWSVCRCADVSVKLQLCMDQLSQVSDILPLVEVHTYILCIY